MPNVGGPSARRRALLYNVVQSILLYAAPVWRKALRIKKHKAKLEKTQRAALLRVASAYRNASTKALQVITGIPPIDMLVEERWRLHVSGEGHLTSTRKAKRDRTVDEWQEIWQEDREVGQWIKRLIPDVRAWYKCGWRTLDDHLTQFLTGHGSFEVYRNRIGKTPDGGCIYCGRETEDTPEHTLMRCPRWEMEREELREITGNIQQVEEITRMMMEDKEKWRRISLIIQRIMKRKEEEERGQ